MDQRRVVVVVVGNCFSAAASLGLTLAATSVAYGQAAANTQEGQLEEVVVTAEHRTEDIQKTAASVSVREGEEMLDQGRYSLEAILQDVPGVVGGAALSPGGVVTSGTDNVAAGITIRGIQSNVGGGGNLTSTPTSVAMYVDDVYSGVGGDFDLDRVEVLRGPQGTLYGRSATAGVVAIHTHDPDLGQVDGFATVELGDYELRHYTAAVNIPAGDTLAVRLSGNSYDREGYISPDGGAVRTQEGRVKVLWKPNDALSVLLGYAADNNVSQSGGINGIIKLTSPGSTYSYQDTPLGSGKNSYHQYWANIVWDFGPATLTYIPAVRTWDSSLDSHQRGGFLNFDEAAHTPEDNFITHELRFSSKPGAKLIWQAGAFYFDNNLFNSNYFSDYPSSAEGDDTAVSRLTRNLGVFGEATYPLTDSWRFTAGVRYDETKVSTTQTYVNNLTANAPPGFGYPEDLVTLLVNGQAGARNFVDWTYKVRLEHDLSPSNMVYASVSTAASPGDVQAVNSVPTPLAQYLQSEILTSYEIGSKNRFFNDALQVNGNLFYESYGGYQAANLDVLPLPEFGFRDVVAPIEVYGAELELLAQVTRYDRIGLNFGYTNAYFVDKSMPVPGTAATFSTFYGEDAIPGVVPLQAQLSYDHSVNLPLDSKLTFHGDVRWLSSHYEGQVSALQLATDASYWNAYARDPGEYIGDLSATWTIKHLSLSGYVRNVGDNRYKTNVNVQDLVGYLTATPYDPRTVGIILTAKW
jgi:iron complex outermembrane receptor protein